MAKSKKRAAVDSAVQSIIGGESESAQADPNPLGVKLTAEEIAELDRIVDELGLGNRKRHSLLQFIVRDFIRRYNEGEKPTLKTKTIKVLE